MKRMIGTAFVVAATLVAVPGRAPLFAQACQDEEGMGRDSKKAITDLVETVKKENLEDFQKAYHQKSCLAKMTLCLSMLTGLVGCLDKAARDTTATKEQAAAYKVKLESCAKLRDKIEHDRDILKKTEVAKEAKALIEKLDLSN